MGQGFGEASGTYPADINPSKPPGIQSQGLQILLMSGVSVTSASQILESFWNIWSQVQEPITSCQVSQRKKPVSDFPSHGPSCGGLLTWKAQIHDGGDGGH